VPSSFAAVRSNIVIGMPLLAGTSAAIKLVVTEADTALAMRSGDVAVLATPRLLALVEEAAMLAVAGSLPEGSTTVGMRVQLDHLHPTKVGTTVVAEATLERCEGRRLTFTVSVTDKGGLVAVGRVTRVVVDLERFLEKAN
jgi:fluoroacetyl-CoA thioesterase